VAEEGPFLLSLLHLSPSHLLFTNLKYCIHFSHSFWLPVVGAKAQRERKRNVLKEQSW
jgi:hypothetical protein